MAFINKFKKLLIYFIYIKPLSIQGITLGFTKHNIIFLDLDHNLLNHNGEIASIAHQYDRHSNLYIIIRNKFWYELAHNERTLEYILNSFNKK